MSTCRGVDVSAIQSTSDWTGYNLAFVIAKASEGRTTRDARFSAHIAAARARGLVTGGYHFGWPVQAVAQEAANYIAAAKATPVDTHWLDLEAYSDRRNVGSMTAAQIRSWATSWVATVKSAFPGQRVGVYASLATFHAGWVPTTADAYWVAQYPVAGLSWANAEARARPVLPSAYGTPLIWQFGSERPSLDRDLAFLGSSDLAAWARKEDDMALTTDDINKIAAAVTKAVLNTDGIIQAPPDDPNVKTNPFWALQSYIKDTNARLRAVETALGGLNGEQIAADAASALDGYEITVTKKGA